jgi:hypothetical protein
MRHELMDFMFADPTMLDDLEYLFKSDMARSLLFFYQATKFNLTAPAQKLTNCS